MRITFYPTSPYLTKQDTVMWKFNIKLTKVQTCHCPVSTDTKIVPLILELSKVSKSFKNTLLVYPAIELKPKGRIDDIKISGGSRHTENPKFAFGVCIKM